MGYQMVSHLGIYLIDFISASNLNACYEGIVKKKTSVK